MNVGDAVAYVMKSLGDRYGGTYDEDVVLQALQNAERLVVKQLPDDARPETVKRSASISQTAAADNVAVPDDMGYLRGIERDDYPALRVSLKLFEVYRSGRNTLLAASDTNPIYTIGGEKILILPVGKTGNSTVYADYDLELPELVQTGSFTVSEHYMAEVLMLAEGLTLKSRGPEHAAAASAIIQSVTGGDRSEGDN